MGAIKQDLEDRTTNKAEEIAEQRYGREFGGLPAQVQMTIWMEAEQVIRDNLADEADNRCSDGNGKGEAHWNELELLRRLGK